MTDQTGGPGTFTGTGNTFNGGLATGTYTLEGDGLLGLTGNAGATVVSGTIADITVGLSVAGFGVAALSNVSITADAGATANIGSLIGAVTSTTLDADGGVVAVGTAVTALGVVDATVSNGGQFEAYQSLLAVLSGSNVTFGAGGGNFTIQSSGLSVSILSGTVINGFASGDVIDDQNISSAGLTGYSITGAVGGDQTVQFFDGATPEGGLTFAPSTFSTTGSFAVGAGPLTFADTGTLQITTCFLSGTAIATSSGAASVESLRPGDLVETRVNGATVLRPIVWIGRRNMDVRLGDGRIESYPVRIRADSFGDNVPARDLLVTGEHCIHVDGRLIPARMLVNGASIIVDTSITRYEYFHIELETHAILIAEGLESESYLDTGNRGNFANAPMPSLRPDFGVAAEHRSWAVDAAAPLAVDRETVEPIWRVLADRAAALGLGVRRRAVELVGEPELRLVTASGLEIHPTLFDGRVYAFVAPRDCGELRLVSRASRPSDVVGPYLDDRRELGVLVGRIGVHDGSRRIELDAHLAVSTLSGWNDPEPGSSCRWTNGDAIVPLNLTALAGRPMILDVEVVRAGPYLAAIDGARIGSRNDALAA